MPKRCFTAGCFVPSVDPALPRASIHRTRRSRPREPDVIEGIHRVLGATRHETLMIFDSIVYRVKNVRHSVEGCLFQGVTWLLVAEGLARLAGLAKVALLGRLLGPRDFGVVAVAVLVEKWISALTQTGIASSLISRPGDVRPYLGTAWLIEIARAIAVFCLIVAVAPLAARYFDCPDSTPIICGVAVSTVLWALINPGVACLRKELNFRSDVAWRVSGLVPGLIVGVGAAVLLRNAWALVFSLLAARLTEVIASFVVVRDRVRPSCERRQLRALMKESRWFSAVYATGFLLYQLDSTATAKALGTTALGYYQVAVQMAWCPVLVVSGALSGVLLPLFTRMREPEQIRRFFISAVKMLGVGGTSLACVLSCYSELIIVALVGPTWGVAAGAVAWLGWAGAARMLADVAAALLTAKGKVTVVVRVQLVQIAVLAILLFTFVPRGGITGTAAAVAMSWLMAGWVLLVYAARVLGCGMLAVVGGLRRSVQVAAGLVVPRVVFAGLGSGGQLVPLAVSLLIAAGIVLSNVRVGLDRVSACDGGTQP